LARRVYNRLSMTFWRAISRLGRSGPKSEPDCGCPDSIPEGDPAFSAAVTALGAKLAKADGRADDAEYDSFLAVFRPDQRSARDIRRLYALARGTTLGFESYARGLARRYRRCPQLLEKVVDGLFHVAKADGAVSGGEIDFIERVGHLFGLSPLTVRRIKTDHLGASPGDPYRLLGVAPDAPDETVRAAWKRALSAHHPDRAHGQGLGSEWVEAAAAKASAINAAFEDVMRERRTLVVGAA
jgi:DnaJ like chaperone protein